MIEELQAVFMTIVKPFALLEVDSGCPMANPGRFTWEWSRTSWTSVLNIDKLSIEASGEYCISVLTSVDQ